MSRTETYGTRSWAWSVFHRCMPSPARMIDMDYLEFCDHCRKPLILGELAMDIGQPFKATTILRSLAGTTKIPAILIFYKEEPIISAVKLITGKDEIQEFPTLTKIQLEALWIFLSNAEEPIFRIQQKYPPNGRERQLTPREFYEFLCRVHEKHEKKGTICIWWKLLFTNVILTKSLAGRWSK